MAPGLPTSRVSQLVGFLWNANLPRAKTPPEEGDAQTLTTKGYDPPLSQLTR